MTTKEVLVNIAMMRTLPNMLEVFKHCGKM